MKKFRIKQEIWETIQVINIFWTDERKTEELKDYFHKDMVATDTDRKRLETCGVFIAVCGAFTDYALKRFTYRSSIAIYYEF